MNRFRTGAGILVLLMALGVWSQWKIDALHRPIAERMKLASEQVMLGQWEAAAENITISEALWQKHRGFTASFADHEPMEEIECLMVQLSPAAAAEDRTVCASLCAEISRRVLAVSEAHQFTLSNFF